MRLPQAARIFLLGVMASVGWVERSDTHHAFVAMGIGLDGLNPSYAL